MLARQAWPLLREIGELDAPRARPRADARGRRGRDARQRGRQRGGLVLRDLRRHAGLTRSPRGRLGHDGDALGAVLTEALDERGCRDRPRHLVDRPGHLDVGLGHARGRPSAGRWAAASARASRRWRCRRRPRSSGCGRACRGGRRRPRAGRAPCGRPRAPPARPRRATRCASRARRPAAGSPASSASPGAPAGRRRARAAPGRPPAPGRGTPRRARTARRTPASTAAARQYALSASRSTCWRRCRACACVRSARTRSSSASAASR